MDKAQMVNVDAAAIMHDGKWLKISDRNEVENLKNQNNSLQNQVNNMQPNVWLDCDVGNVLANTGQALFNPRTSKLIAVGVPLHHYGGYVFYNGNPVSNYMTVYPPNGYKFDGNTSTFISANGSSDCQMTQYNGKLLAWAFQHDYEDNKLVSIYSYVGASKI